MYCCVNVITSWASFTTWKINYRLDVKITGGLSGPWMDLQRYFTQIYGIYWTKAGQMPLQQQENCVCYMCRSPYIKWPLTALLPAMHVHVDESLKPTLSGVEQLTYSGEFKLSPSVVRSLPRARWTIPGSVSAARINVSRPIMPNWSVTIPEGMFVTRPAAAAAWIIQSAANLWDWTVILSQHLLSIHYLQFYTTLCAHTEDPNPSNSLFLTGDGNRQTNGNMMMVYITVTIFF